MQLQTHTHNEFTSNVVNLPSVITSQVHLDGLANGLCQAFCVCDVQYGPQVVEGHSHRELPGALVIHLHMEHLEQKISHGWGPYHIVIVHACFLVVSGACLQVLVKKGFQVKGGYCVASGFSSMLQCSMWPSGSPV